MRQTAFIFLSILLSIRALGSETWPQFRGPTQDGTVDAKGLPVRWNEQNRIKWKTEIPGEGWSSPLVGDERIWLTTSMDEGHSLHAICLDLGSGKIIRDIEVFKIETPPPKHRRNSYASPTGILEGNRVYVHFGSMGTACLDAQSGAVLWENRDLKVDHQNGPGGSLASWKDKLLIPCDGLDFQYEVGLDKATGKVSWKTTRSGLPELMKLPADMRKAYGTAVVFQIDGRAESVTTASNRLYALNPENGEEIWHFDYPQGFSNVPLPVSDGKVMVISTGFMKPVLIGLKVGSMKGDVTESHVLWRQPAGGPDQCSPIVVRTGSTLRPAAGFFPA